MCAFNNPFLLLLPLVQRTHTQVVDTAKWQSWKSLGNMSGMEAMRLFVRTLEEDQPDWHAFPMPPVSRSAASGGKAFLPAGIAAAAAGAGGAATTGSAAGAPATTWTASLKPGSWSPLPLPPDARKPAPRYEHGTAYVDGRVIVIGGNYAGRYLGDTWAFDLTSQRWSQLALTRADADAAAGAPAAAEGADAAAAAAAAPAAPPAPPPAFPACAGFSVTQHGGLLYLLGGHERSKATASPAAASTSGGGAATLAVRTLDPKTLTVRTLPTTGTAPVARGGHCAVAIGGRIYVFGGEDTGRR